MLHNWTVVRNIDRMWNNVRFIRWASLLYVSRWDSICFNTTIKCWKLAIQKAFVVAIGLYKLLFSRLASYDLHDKSLRGAVLLLPFPLTYLSLWAPNERCLAADDALTGFSNSDRRRCRSVAQNVCVAAWKRVDVTLNICCNTDWN